MPPFRSVTSEAPSTDSLTKASTMSTLTDLMVMLLDLHPARLVQSKVSTIKNLRLVSKEVGSIVLTAVRSCEVYLGGRGHSPDAQQLVRLMAGMQLERLRLSLTVPSGEA